jgi:TonB-linked SusC/RagA family outer membrane protein
MKKIFALLCFTVVTLMSISAQKTITGTIIDTEGIPLIGANVLVKGTTVGTIADIDGSYEIEVPVGFEVLVCSYTGYITKEFNIDGRTVIDITLEQNAQIIDEVVVVGYKTQSKPKSNVATQVVSSQTIEARPNASIVQTLQGQVAGLNITTSSGQPGANSTIQLRGVSSINGNTEPLFIIDGTPVDEDNFRSINPNEIESVSVLKDAGATAIYGNRGANGVIVMKTKNGDYNSGLQFKYSTLFSQASLQPIDYDLMGAQELLRLEQRYGAGRGTTLPSDPDRVINLLGDTLSIASVEGTDWLDFFFRNPITQQHNLSVSTGGKLFNTYTNFGFMDQQGILEDSGLKRYNLRTNLNGKSEDGKFNFGLNLSLNYSTSDEPNNIGTGAVNRNFILGAYIGLPYFDINEYTGPEPLLAVGDFSATPLVLYDRLLTFTRVENEIKSIANLNASYQITDDISVRSSLGADFADQIRLTAEGPTSYNALLFAETGNNTPGFQAQSSTRVFSYNWLNSVNYNKTFNNVHTIDVGLYTELFKARYDFFSYSANGLDPRTFSPGDGSGFVDDNLANDFFIDQAAANILEAGLFSYFGSLDYDYNSRFGFGATVRRDASFRFAESNRWGLFYSFSGRWNLEQEEFMANTPFDMLKLRGSWGKTGNQRIVDSGGFLNYFGGPDLTENFFATGPGYGGSNALFLSQIGNTTLRWETVTQGNIGLDFELFRSRLRGSFDYYVKTTDDLFQNRPVSAINSVTSIRANVGSLRNSGYDFNIAYDVLTSSNGVNLELFFNTNYNKQEIIDLPTPDGRIVGGTTVTREGSVLNEYYVYRYAGINPANGNLLFLDGAGNFTENPSPDTNEDGDRVYTGKNIYPDYFGSFGFNFGYKGFYFETQFNYTIGVYRFDNDYADLMDPTFIGQFRVSRDILRAWENEGDVTDVPSLFATNLALDGNSDRFLQSADYVRLRFVRLGYNFPSNLLIDGIERLSIYANAENMITWSGWRGYDPESAVNGVRRYPTPRIISVGLDLQF